jgi:hypothetical protein
MTQNARRGVLAALLLAAGCGRAVDDVPTAPSNPTEPSVPSGPGGMTLLAHLDLTALGAAPRLGILAGISQAF